MQIDQEGLKQGPDWAAGIAASHPASCVQEALWFLDQTLGEPAVYNIAFRIDLRGTLRLPELRESLDLLIQRYEILRTHYGWEAGELRQLVRATQPLPCPLLELAAVPEPGRSSRLEGALAELARGRFDLAQGPLLRVLLVRLEADRQVLALVFHHSIFDGASLTPFLACWRTLYRQLCDGQQPDLPALACQFGEHARRQRRELSSPAMEAHRRFWEDHLGSAPRLLNLPLDRPRPLTQGAEAARHGFRVAPELLAELKTFARQNRGTLFLALLTAFQVLMAQLSGQDDLVTGTVVSARQGAAGREQIGMFVNTLALRADLAGNPSLVEAFARVRGTLVAASGHRNLPFEEVVRTLNPSRNSGHSPLFQAMLVMHEAPAAGATFTGQADAVDHIQTGLTMFELTLTVVETAHGIDAQLEYLTGLFDPSTAAAMAAQYVSLLRVMASNPEVRLDDLAAPAGAGPALARTGELRELPLEPVHARFERQAALAPDAPALVWREQRLSYGELEQLSGQVAAGLRARGVGRGVPVGIFMDPCLLQVVAMLGVLRAGGMYVPLNPDHPWERRQFTLQDTGMPWVLCDVQNLERLPETAARPLVLDLAALAAAGRAAPVEPVAGDAPACVYYTSGSTGQPKGVVVRHRGLVNILEFMGELLGVDAGARTLALTPFTFDICGVERLLPLRAGALVELVDRATAVDPAALARAIDALDPTFLQATPATWRMLAEAGWRGNGRLQLLCGGETLPAAVAEYLLAQGGAVWNLYGPTETSIWSTFHRVTAADLPDLPIGLPVWNTRVLLLDPRLRPVAPGAKGEICLGGSGLAEGYLNQAAQTLSRFPADPDRPGERFYRTGDLGSWRPDGSLAFHGRLDHQVKIRGHRIELTELEAVLARHPEVLQAVVDVRESGHGPRLVAFFVALPGSAPSRVTLQAFMKETLPAYMVPDHFISCNRLPVRNGKLDRAAVHAKPLDTPADQAPRVAPRSPIESLLVHLWAELLEREDIGILDDFFDLGGHSLLSIRLQSRIEEAFGRRVALAGMVEGITVEGLARALAADAAGPDEAPWIQFQAGAGRSTLFYLHGDLPAGGLYSRALARGLGPERPLVAIHPHGSAGQPLASSVEGMATDHLALIRRLQPHGPYLLGGYCNGALEALEIARMLTAQGEAVERVVMVAPPPALRLPLEQPEALRQLESQCLLAEPRHQPGLRAIFQAATSHVRRSYPGAVTLLMPAEGLPPGVDPALGWGQLLPAMAMRTIPGGHETCLGHPALGSAIKASLT